MFLPDRSRRSGVYKDLINLISSASCYCHCPDKPRIQILTVLFIIKIFGMVFWLKSSRKAWELKFLVLVWQMHIRCLIKRKAAKPAIDNTVYPRFNSQLIRGVKIYQIKGFFKVKQVKFIHIFEQTIKSITDNLWRMKDIFWVLDLKVVF